MEKKKLELTLTVKLLNEIEKYQKENNILYRTTAITELIRKGLQK